MSTARVIKPKPIEANSRTTETRTVETKRSTDPSPRKKRSASCPRCNHSNYCEAKKTSRGVPGNTNERKTKPITASSKTQDAKIVQKEQRACPPQPKSLLEIQSCKAFTVIPPNPKKRNEIQKKAEAELAALEHLRLSQAMSYVSIAPSTVGGCLTLEEVRNKQQQEMQMSRRKKQVKRCLLAPLPVLHQ